MRAPCVPTCVFDPVSNLAQVGLFCYLIVALNWDKVSISHIDGRLVLNVHLAACLPNYGRVGRT